MFVWFHFFLGWKNHKRISIFQKVTSCETKKSSDARPKNINLKSLSIMYSKMVFQIFQNHTVRDENGKYCYNDKSVPRSVATYRGNISVQLGARMEQLPYIKKLYFHPFFSHELLLQMRFISCGAHTMSSILFSEVTNMFDH